ncbi:MAG: hypothetical protein R3250_10400, partial [Melioribacteraceae bacterium]|nr:hypothetical protein [Melioribacteraceae bacterium]
MTRIVLLLISISIQAQNLDSLYRELVNIKTRSNSEQAPAQIESTFQDKCAFGLLATMRENYSQYSKQQQDIISDVMARPELSTSIVSPSGFFRLHYDESGTDAPLYDITDLAEALDSAFNFEINILGYPVPPSDGNLGGDDKYDVYVLNLGGGLYGATTPETTIGEGKYISYMEIDNSFEKNEGYNSYGIDGARVTAAHEFHHAIQLGGYIFRSEDTYYYELTSTAFEEFVYDEVNDYYAYMPSYFRNTRNKFENNSGYNLAVWNIFLQEKFNDEDPLLGHKIVKRSWENIVNDRAVVGLAKAITAETDLTFGQLFNEFGDWLYFTDSRAKPGEFFEESQNYPLVRSSYTLQLNNNESLTFVSQPTSINYLTFFDYSSGFADTIVAVLSNSDVVGSTTNNTLNVDFTISNDDFENAVSIGDLFYAKIESDGIEQIQGSYIVNNELSDQEFTREEISF